MKLVSYFLFRGYLFTILFSQGDPFDFRDRVRSCVVSVYDSDISHDSMSMTDLAKRSLETPSSAKVTGFFANFADPAELQGMFYCYLLLF